MTSFRKGSSSVTARIGSGAALLKLSPGDTPVSDALVGTAHFLNAPKQVVDDTSIVIEVAAEQFDPSDSLTSITLEKVDGDDGSENVVSTLSMSRGTAQTFKGSEAKTNQVAPWSTNASLDLGENIFRVQYTGGDGSTSVSKYHHVYRKSSLLETTVSSKSDLVRALGRSLRNPIDTSGNANHDGSTESTWRWDVIKVSTSLSFEWSEFESTSESILSGGIVPNPANTSRNYPVVIEPTGAGSLVFKMDYAQYWKTNGRDSTGSNTPQNFGSESFSVSMMHFKSCVFGVSGQALSSVLSQSSAMLADGSQQILTLEDCTIHDKFLRSGDSSLPVSPAVFPLGAYLNVPYADYPPHDDYAPGTAVRESNAGISIASGVASIPCTGLAYLYSDRTAPNISLIEVEDLGSSTYEVRLTFASQEMADIFVGMTNWIQACDYAGVDVLSADGSGWTSSVMQAGSAESNNAFRSEIQSNTSAVITLRGSNSNTFGAAVFAAGSTKLATIKAAMKNSLVLKSTVVGTSLQSGSDQPVQRVSFVGCYFNGIHNQGGIATSVERFVNCHIKDLRGDLGHGPMLVFNVAFEGGKILLNADFRDSTHADVLQTYGVTSERIGGAIFQNIYQGQANATDGPDETIPIFFDRTPMAAGATEYRHRGWIVDNWEMDSNYYVFNSADASVTPFVGNSQLAARMQNLRISNCDLTGTSLLARFDFSNSGTSRALDFASDSSAYFHNNSFYAIGWVASILASSGTPGKINYNYGATYSEPPSGSETNIGVTLSDVSQVGSERIGTTWTGTNTVKPAPTGP